MVIKTYFDKNNTIALNDYTNTGRNPIAELFYGGSDGTNTYSRYLFHFDETRLKSLYTGGTFTDLTKLKHTLKLTNTSSFDTSLLNGTYMGSYQRSSSFDLIVFKISEDWDEGVGYDYRNAANIITGEAVASTQPSNWFYSKTGIYWDNGGGTYSGNPTNIIVGTQHFDAGNENMEIDITDYVNGVLTGDTNYGLGIAYGYAFEQLKTISVQYTGFFTRHTQTAYEPYVETQYQNYIKDDRSVFYLDKPNKLYLYVNLNGNPTNLDVLPTCTVLDNSGNIYSAYTSSDIEHVTKGVYAINVLIPTTIDFTVGTILNDVWSNIIINGVSRPDITLGFELRDSLQYYNIGDSTNLPKPVAVSISGVRNQEKIIGGDVRKVIVSTRIPYTIEQYQNIDYIYYRLYVKEGQNQLTVIDYEPVEQANNYNYFLLDTASLIPNTYYLDVKVITNLDELTFNGLLSFDIVSQSNYRISQ
jgi:hypothetical protein